MEAEDVLMSEVQESMDAMTDSVVDLEVNDENYSNASRKRKGSTPPMEHNSDFKRQKSDDGEQSNDSDLVILEPANSSPTANCRNPSPSGCDEMVNYVSSDTDDDGNDNNDVDHVDGQSTVEHNNDGNEMELVPPPVLHTVSDGEDGDEDVILISDDNSSPLDDHCRRQLDIVDLVPNPVREWPNGVAAESAALITECSHVVDEEVAVIQAAQSVNSHYRGSLTSASGSHYSDAGSGTPLSPSATRCSRFIFTREHDGYGATASSSSLPPPPSLLPRTAAQTGIHHQRHLHSQRPSGSSLAPSRHLNEIRRVICDPHSVTADELEAMGQPTRQSIYALDPLTNMRFYEPHYRYKAGGGPLNAAEEVYCLSKVTQIGERICSVENKFSELVDLVSQFLKSKNGRSTAKKPVKRKKLVSEEAALRKTAEREAERQKQAADERRRRAERRRRSSELGGRGTASSADEPPSPSTSSQMVDQPREAQGPSATTNDDEDVVGAATPKDDGVCDAEKEVENAEPVLCRTAGDAGSDEKATRLIPPSEVADPASCTKEIPSPATSEHK